MTKLVLSWTGYLGQRSFLSNASVRAQTHTHTHQHANWADCFIWTTKNGGNYYINVDALRRIHSRRTELDWTAACELEFAQLKPINFVTLTHVTNDASRNWVNVVQVSSVQFSSAAANSSVGKHVFTTGVQFSSLRLLWTRLYFWRVTIFIATPFLRHCRFFCWKRFRFRQIEYVTRW